MRQLLRVHEPGMRELTLDLAVSEGWEPRGSLLLFLEEVSSDKGLQVRTTPHQRAQAPLCADLFWNFG